VVVAAASGTDRGTARSGTTRLAGEETTGMHDSNKWRQAVVEDMVVLVATTAALPG
jgi:hypothetical protein